MYRRHAVLVVALLVLVAGCTGGASNGGPSAAADDATTTATPQPPGEATAANAAATTVDGDTGWDRESFRAGQYYQYDVRYPEAYGTGTFEWEVLAVTADSVTVRSKLDTDEVTYEATSTAPPDEIYTSFAGSPIGTFVFVGLLSPALANAENRPLAVGEGWEYSGPDGSVSYRVERTGSHAGLDCSVVVVRIDGQTAWETCVAPESPLPGQLTLVDDTGERVFEMTLVEYRG